jgi:hypothetical protein
LESSEVESNLTSSTHGLKTPNGPNAARLRPNRHPISETVFSFPTFGYSVGLGGDSREVLQTVQDTDVFIHATR